MRDFNCPNCGQRLAFENSVCLSCGSALGFSLDDMALLVIASGDGQRPRRRRRLPASTSCARICIWPNAIGWSRSDPAGLLCTSCALTRTRPNDADTKALAAFAEAEKAKRRLIAELHELKLPIVGRDEDPDYGLAFDLLSSEHEKVITGHDNGVITLDLAEGDDVHREQLRVAMDEPYRTLLGHFRHEIGHYYFYRLVEPVAGLRGAVQRAVRRPRRRLPGGAGPPLQRGRARGLGGELRLVLRHHASRRGLGRDVRALPAHPRHPGHRRGLRFRAGRRRPSSDGCWAPAVSTRSSRCGCRCRGR